jgi:hypothetical protein
MFGAPGSAGAAGEAATAGAGWAAARSRRAVTWPAPAVVRARLGATGSGRAVASPGAATRGLAARFGGAWCSSGIVTLISGSGIAPGVVGEALGVVEGALPAPLDGSATGGDAGCPDSGGLAGSAASAGLSSAGWPRPAVNNAADNSSPAASLDVKRNMSPTESE